MPRGLCGLCDHHGVVQSLPSNGHAGKRPAAPCGLSPPPLLWVVGSGGREGEAVGNEGLIQQLDVAGRRAPGRGAGEGEREGWGV